MNRLLRNSVSLILISFLALSNSLSQSEYFDTKGKEFWFAFPPNYHNHFYSSHPELSRGDSLYVFIMAEAPTSGVIEYTERSGITRRHNFSINSPNQLHKFAVSFNEYETSGRNRSGRIVSDDDSTNWNEKIAKNSFHVVTDEEVTVYAHNQAVYTSDAFLALPEDVLGTEYYIMSYRSDGHPYEVNGDTYEYSNSTPSQFIIISAEDNNEIIIEPSAPTKRHGTTTQRVTLNEGDVYLVQARVTESSEKTDLTGTRIASSKPVAVLAGQQRALAPVDNIYLRSRDYLIEQLPPVKTWGKNAFIIPYEKPRDATNSPGDLYRVLAAKDNTTLYIDGSVYANIDAGEFLEEIVSRPISIGADKPILAAQIKKTSLSASDEGQYPAGDPFLAILPPKEQFQKSYLVCNIQAKETETYEVFDETRPTGDYIDAYEKHYIAIVSPNAAIASVKIDGAAVNSNMFLNVANSNYSYASFDVSEGLHSVEADEEIGVYVYGYGEINSYGYVGGMSMKPINNIKPTIQTNIDCYTIEGFVYQSDTLGTKPKIGTVEFPDSSRANVRIDFQNIDDYRVDFKVELIDEYLDGKFAIEAVNDYDNLISKQYEIPGFTVALDSIENDREIPVFRSNLKATKTNLENFTLENYGAFDHTITDSYWKNGSGYTVSQNPPFEIKSDSKKPFNITFYSDIQTNVLDTLTIEDKCGARDILAIDLTFKIDNVYPEVGIILDSCNRFGKITATDSTSFDWGLKSFRILKTVNCFIDSILADANVVEYSFEVVDPYQDAIYEIEARDSVGNTSILSDTIQGFTIDITADKESSDLDFGSVKLGDLNCKKLNFRNYGLFSFKIEDLFVYKNVDFSIPQNQYPLEIAPGDSSEILVCYRPRKAFSQDFDTLSLYFNCETKIVSLTGEGDSLVYRGESECGADLKFAVKEIPESCVLKNVSPNPASSEVNFRLKIIKQGELSLRIYDSYGVERYSVKRDARKGIVKIGLGLSDFPDGVYFYRLSVGGKILAGKFIILK